MVKTEAVKFLVTEECGRLARWLRLMGYDTAQATMQSLTELYRMAYSQHRIVVTRNSRVSASCLFPVIHLNSPLLEEQLRQLLRELKLELDDIRFFTRCDRCNVPVEEMEKPLVRDLVPPYVYRTQERFFSCPSCQRIYWPATHW